MAGNPRTILMAADPAGEVGHVEALLEQVDRTGAGALALAGSLAGAGARPETYRALFKTMGSAKVQTFWIPGAQDAPLARYLRESYNIELAFPFLHGVHGAMAMSPDHVVYAGMGGEIVDDPDAVREEQRTLRYPAWEVEYRLKVLRELAHDYQKVFLFTTVPAHKGEHRPGSEILAELIKTYSPRVALVAGGEGVGTEMLANTLVVFPGSLARGEYAVVDIHDRTMKPAKLA
jgi:Icc-related predicted phosphoesterase